MSQPIGFRSTSTSLPTRVMPNPATPEALTFEGNRFQKAKRSLKLALPLGAMLAMGNGCATTSYQTTTPPTTNQITDNVHWDRNIRVLGSSSQWLNSYMDTEGGLYTQSLLNTLKRPNIRSLEEAHRFLEVHGYAVSGDTMRPYSTPTPHLNIWQKAEQGKRRIAFLFSQKPLGNLETASFHNDIENMRNTLKRIYGLRDDQIRVVEGVNTRQEIIDGIDWLNRQVQADPDNTEVLVYYSGHGSVRWPNTNPILEGDGEGWIGATGLTEVQLQGMMNGRMNGAKSLVILDTCHAGSWIAEEVATKPGNKLHIEG